MSANTVIDWVATGSMLQGWSTLIGSISVFAAAKIGANTFNNWKRQKLAERHIDQAERILDATYKVRRDLSRLRNPVMWGHELEAAEEALKASGEWLKAFTKEDETRFRKAQAFYNRLNQSRDNRLALEACQPMARAFFGEELETAIESLIKNFWTVQVYIDADLNEKTGSDLEFRQKIDATLWEGYPSKDENEMDKEIAGQVATIERICVSVLRLDEPKKLDS